MRSRSRRLPALLFAIASYGCVCACGTAPAPQPALVATDAIADRAVKDFDLRELEASVARLSEGAVRDYYAGVLAGRRAQAEDATRLLTRALATIRDSHPAQAAVALDTLASVNLANSNYAEAARAYDDLRQHFAGYLDDDRADDAALARILSAVPPQTITWTGPVRIATTTNPIGSQSAALLVNGVRESWLIDTGANFSVVSRSFADRLGLTPLAGEGEVGSGTTGLKSTMRATVLPSLSLGGATLANVVLMVLDDASLRIGSSERAYQLHAILGYPVLRALGAITLTHDGEFRAGDGEKTAAGARVFMRGLAPAIECEVNGQPLAFTFDTGASGTDLSVRYYDRFRANAARWTKRTMETGGAGGSVMREFYLEPTLALTFGTATVTLTDVGITAERTGAGLDMLFGNLGQDLLENVESFTLDFTSMRFAVGPARPSVPQR